MLHRIVLVSVLCIESSLAAAPVRLTEEAIRQSLVGSLLEIDTPLGCQDAEGKIGTATIATPQGPAIANTPPIDTGAPLSEATAVPESPAETTVAQADDSAHWEAPRFTAVDLSMSEAPPAFSRETKLAKPKASTPRHSRHQSIDRECDSGGECRTSSLSG